MRHFNVFTSAREADRVLANDISAPDRDDLIGRKSCSAAPRGLRQTQRRARWSILLGDVVGFNDAAIDIVKKNFCGLFNEPREDRDTHRSVRREEHRTLFRHLAEHVHRRLFKSCCAHKQGRRGPSGHVSRRRDTAHAREINHDIGVNIRERVGICADLDRLTL